MIKTFRNKGLQLFFETGVTTGISADQAGRLRLILALLDEIRTMNDVPPALAPHPLKGPLQGKWAVKVNRNWRLTFELRDGDVYELDYVDYH